MMSLRDERLAAERHVREIREDIKRFEEDYIKECLDKSPYTVGQKLILGGNDYFVSGAFESCGNVYLSINFPKKDGTMSKREAVGRHYINISQKD